MDMNNPVILLALWGVLLTSILLCTVFVLVVFKGGTDGEIPSPPAHGDDPERTESGGSAFLRLFEEPRPLREDVGAGLVEADASDVVLAAEAILQGKMR